MTQVSKPYTFSNGTTADANQVNQDFDALYNVVDGGIDSSNITDGTIATVDLMNEAVTPAKSKGLAYAVDVFGGSFIYSGGAPTKDATNANTIDVPAYAAYITQPDGTLRRLTTSATTFVTNVANGTFYLDLNPDGTFSWGGSHSTQSGYITICTVLADSSSNVSTITDTRPTTVSILGGSVGQKLLGTVYPIYGLANRLRPSIANFTRNSIAYRKNFSQVVAGQIRTEMGAMGDAPYSEESTSNLFTANQSNVESGTTGFTANGTGVTLSQDTSTGNYLEGTASLKTVCDSTVTAQGFYVGITASATTQYTASVWLKGSGTITLSLSGAGITTVTSSPITLTNTWTRYTITGTTNGSGGALNLVVATNSTQAVTFWADALQIEQKAYATSFVTGGSTRNADSLSYTLDKPLPSRWFGALRWIPDQSSSVINRNVQLLTGTSSSSSQRYALCFNNSGVGGTGKFSLSKSVDGSTWNTVLSSAITFNAGDVVTVLFEDDPITAQQISIWVGINGGTLQQFTIPNTSIVTDTKIVYLGCTNTSGPEANGTVEPLITTTIPTTEQLNWLYNAPLWGQGNFPSSIGTNFLKSLSGGTKIQSGTVSATAGGNYTVTFPTAFSSTPVVLASYFSNGSASSYPTTVTAISSTSITVNVSGGAAGGSIQWMAIGN